MKRQNGMALITVLSVLAVVSVITTSLLAWQHTAMQQTTLRLQTSQSMDYLQAMEDWAEAVLLRDLSKGAVDSLDESWALNLAPVEVDRGLITGHLEDLQGRFNLNNLLVKGKYQAEEGRRLQRLMKLIGVDGHTALEVTNAVRDWMDADQSENFPGGAEDYYYLNLSPPYRTADRPFISATELLLVKGMTEELWRKLNPHITALPGYRPVNVNTASKAVLQSLADDMDEKLAEDILDYRMDTPFPGVSKFIQFRRDYHGNMPSLPKLDKASISVASQFFLLSGSVDIDAQHMHGRALIYRDKKNASVIQRSFKTDL